MLLTSRLSGNDWNGKVFFTERSFYNLVAGSIQMYHDQWNINNTTFLFLKLFRCMRMKHRSQKPKVFTFSSVIVHS
jgi:hypothetical protein